MKKIIIFSLFVVLFCGFVKASSYLDCGEVRYDVSSDLNAKVMGFQGTSYFNNCDLYVQSPDLQIITYLIFDGAFDVGIEDEYLNLESTKDFSQEGIYFLNGYPVTFKEGVEIYFIGEDWVRIYLDIGEEIIIDDLLFFAEEESYFDFKTKNIENRDYLEIVLTEGINIFSEESYDGIIINNYRLHLSENSNVGFSNDFLIFTLNEQSSCTKRNEFESELLIYDLSNSFDYLVGQDKCNTLVYLKSRNLEVYEDYLKIYSQSHGNNITFSFGDEFIEGFIMSEEDILLINANNLDGEWGFNGLFIVQEDAQDREQLVICGKKPNLAQSTTLGKGTEINFSIGYFEDEWVCDLESCFFSANWVDSKCSEIVCTLEDRSFELICANPLPIITIDGEFMNDFYYDGEGWSCDYVDCFGTLAYLHSYFDEMNYFSDFQGGNSYFDLFTNQLGLDTIVGFKSLKFDETNWNYVLDVDSFSVGGVRFMPQGEAYISEGSLLINFDSGVVYDQNTQVGYILKKGDKYNYNFYVDDYGNLEKIDCCMGEYSFEDGDYLGEDFFIVGCEVAAIKSGDFFDKEDVFLLESKRECSVYTGSLEELKEGDRFVGEGEVEDSLSEEPFLDLRDSVYKEPVNTWGAQHVPPYPEDLAEAIAENWLRKGNTYSPDIVAKATTDYNDDGISDFPYRSAWSSICCGAWTGLVISDVSSPTNGQYSENHYAVDTGYAGRDSPYVNLDEVIQDFGYPIVINEACGCLSRNSETCGDHCYSAPLCGFRSSDYCYSLKPYSHSFLLLGVGPGAQQFYLDQFQNMDGIGEDVRTDLINELERKNVGVNDALLVGWSSKNTGTKFSAIGIYQYPNGRPGDLRWPIRQVKPFELV
ncbi:hypothetical protein HOD38_00895 [archaeon]|jgi:hypothetical protein|nr:hypothetical protein [archaeon]MBT4396803.1 hypothetical protein [archaeon]MBT4441519.1 hypothetical protein [archaeon]